MKWSNANWISVLEQLPPVGKIVKTKIHDKKGCRNEQKLKFHESGLWFTTEIFNAMYVYYQPTHWAL
jgi:hypothetical protein